MPAILLVSSADRAGAQPSVPALTVGPQTITINTGAVWWQQPDGAIQLFPNAAGTSYVAIFGDGAPTQFLGPNLDCMAQNGPSPAPVVQAPGSHSHGDPNYDGNGTWMMAAQRASDGTLVALMHCEDHTFPDGVYGEWNSAGIWTSTNDGSSWTNLGEVIGAPLPAHGTYGGLDATEMIYCSQQGGWLAYDSGIPFLSKDAHAAPGTWYGYYNGAFSQHIDPTQAAPPLSNAPGLAGTGVTWGNITWNNYLNAYTYVWASGSSIKIVLSSDGLNWGAPATLFTDTISGQSIAYPTLIGLTPSSTLTGQDCLITYGVSPSGDAGNNKSLAENWIHFGALTTPGIPNGIAASNAQTYDAAINVSWNRVPMTQTYNVWRATGSGTFTLIGTVQSSSAVPNYVDRAVSIGTNYSYQVSASNSAGTSAASPVTAAISPAAHSYTIQPIAGNPGFALDSTGLSSGSYLPIKPLTGGTSQQWTFSNGPNYTITNAADSLVADVYQASKTAGANIDLYWANGAANQQWNVNQTGPSCTIISPFSGYSLNIIGAQNYSGADVCQWSGVNQWLIASLPAPTNVTATSPGYDSSVTVSWTAVPSAQAYSVWRYNSTGYPISMSYLGGVVPPANSGTLSFVDRHVTAGTTYNYCVTGYDVNAFSYFATSGFSASASFTPAAKYYRIKSVQSGLLLDSSGISAGGTLKQQYATGATSQNWQFVTADGTNYALINQADGYAIDDLNAATSSTYVDLAAPAGTQGGSSTPAWTTGQQFSLGSDNLGTLLRNSYSGLYLNNVGNSSSPNNPQCLWPYAHTSNENWVIY